MILVVRLANTGREGCVRLANTGREGYGEYTPIAPGAKRGSLRSCGLPGALFGRNCLVTVRAGWRAKASGGSRELSARVEGDNAASVEEELGVKIGAGDAMENSMERS
jgi:hypothetical protein